MITQQLISLATFCILLSHEVYFRILVQNSPQFQTIWILFERKWSPCKCTRYFTNSYLPELLAMKMKKENRLKVEWETCQNLMNKLYSSEL